MTARSYTIEPSRDFKDGMDFTVLLTGPAVGGYADQNASYGGKFYREEHARKAGEIFVETGLLPAFQTDDRIAERRSMKARVGGKEARVGV